MKTGYLQFSPLFGKIKENVSKVLSMLERVEADLIVLPELFSTGYDFQDAQNLRSLAETKNGWTVSRIADFAQRKSMWIAGGFAEKENNLCYNSAFLIGPDGLEGIYRKTHLFFREKEIFTPGNTGFQVWDTGKAKIGLMICFDWIFPESARSLALKGAQIICHPSNLVLPYAWSVMPARCIENRIFAVTANRTGTEGSYKFRGHSIIMDPPGNFLAAAGENDECVTVVEINPEQADNKWVTEKNHVINDRRPDIYNL
jgi:predicted amidohydrolase